MGVTVTGVGATLARIDAVKGRLVDLSPVLTVAAIDTKTLIDDSFAQSRAPDGTPWAPLSPATLARRRGGSGNPLIDTSRLRNSTTAYGRGTTLSFGTNVSYGGAQQWGFTRSGSLKRKAYKPPPPREAGSPWTVTVPSRKFLPVEKTTGYTLMRGGPAGEHWRQVREMVRVYIATGRVS